MSVSQALAASLSGVNATQEALSLVAGNVANANTPGYVSESLRQIEVGTAASGGTTVDVTGINRNLDQLLQAQLWTESSGGAYADKTASIYQQLQQIYGTPGSPTSFDGIYNNFTGALQALSANPSSYSLQSAALGAAQGVAQNLNSMTFTIQQLRTQAEQGIATDVQSANTALTQIAQINLQLEGSSIADSAAAALADQRDEDIATLSKLMNVRVVANPNNQISVFTGTGLQLVSGVQASQLNFDNSGTLSATSLWNADPSKDGVGTITLVSPGGSTTDLIADNAIQSGELAAYVQMRDSILPQAQTQLDEFANQMAQGLTNQTVGGTAVSSGGQSGFYADIASLLPGNSIALNYTGTGNVAHTLTIVALGSGGALPLQASPPGSNNQLIGVDFSAGMSSVVTQLNAALGGNLQFSNPSGTQLQVVNKNSATTVTGLSATSTVTSLTGGTPQVALFTDGNQPITGALLASGSQTTGLAGRIGVNPALIASPGNLIAYSANVAAGDPTRPNFLLNQLTTGVLTFSPSTGVGSAQAPFSGTLTDYMSEVVSQQSQAANAATNLQQGQDTVVSALQQRFNDQSGVNIDTEMSNLIALQNAYGANARVMTAVQQMMSTLLQVVQ